MLTKNIIGIIIIFIVIILCRNNNYEKFTNYMLLPEHQNAVCSMSCCYHGWTTMDVHDGVIKKSDIDTKYKRSGTMCDNGISNGCICLPINK